MKTKKILERIEKLEKWYLRDFIKSLDLTPEQMEILADHENKYIRKGLAQNPNLTEELMILLSSDEGWNVKWWLAKNPNLTDEVMINLSNDEDENVRRQLARNDNLPDKVMVKLSSDEGWNVKWWLAENPNLIEEVMIKLGSDEDRDVRYEAFKQLKNLNSLSSDDLESAYDLINNSKYIGRKYFKETFDYIAKKFPELSELAKMFKRIILKGKKDLK